MLEQFSWTCAIFPTNSNGAPLKPDLSVLFDLKACYSPQSVRWLLGHVVSDRKINAVHSWSLRPVLYIPECQDVGSTSRVNTLRASTPARSKLYASFRRSFPFILKSIGNGCFSFSTNYRCLHVFIYFILGAVPRFSVEYREFNKPRQNPH